MVLKTRSLEAFFYASDFKIDWSLAKKLVARKKSCWCEGFFSATVAIMACATERPHTSVGELTLFCFLPSLNHYTQTVSLVLWCIYFLWKTLHILSGLNIKIGIRGGAKSVESVPGSTVLPRRWHFLNIYRFYRLEHFDAGCISSPFCLHVELK